MNIKDVLIKKLGGYTWAEHQLWGGECYRAGWGRKPFDDYNSPKEYKKAMKNFDRFFVDEKPVSSKKK